jgi:hypothetical protein
MKILFLCGSLENQKDGVGDYTRNLAGAIIKKGNVCQIVALMDKGSLEDTHEIQKIDGVEIEVLRLPYENGFHQNAKSTMQLVESFNPDWISLQYVPFSFHHKGMPFGFHNALLPLLRNRNFHIMFHELWVGISVISPLKHKILGFFQQRIAKQIINKSKPLSITTTNILYDLVLNKANIKPTVLPLFSNISKVEANNNYFNSLLTQYNITDPSSCYFVGVFGTIYPQANIEDELMNLYESKEKNKKIVFLHFGRIGVYGKKELERLKDHFIGMIQFIELGELPSDKVSTILQKLHIGISCTPSQHVGKSGVYAALKLHGVDVVMSGGEFLPDYDVELQKKMPAYLNRKPEMWDVSYIAQQFLTTLNISKN